jgi:hypothetical protein
MGFMTQCAAVKTSVGATSVPQTYKPEGGDIDLAYRVPRRALRLKRHPHVLAYDAGMQFIGLARPVLTCCRTGDGEEYCAHEQG